MNRDKIVAEAARLIDKADRATEDAEHWRWQAAEKIGALAADGMSIKAIAAGINRSDTVARRYVKAWQEYGDRNARPSFSSITDGHDTRREQVSPVNRAEAIARWITEDTELAEQVASTPAVTKALHDAGGRLSVGRTPRPADTAQDDRDVIADLGSVLGRCHRDLVWVAGELNGRKLRSNQRGFLLAQARDVDAVLGLVITAIENGDTNLDAAIAALTQEA